MTALVVAAVFGGGGCLRLPLGADRPELARFAAAPVPASAAVSAPPPAVTVVPLGMASDKQPRCAIAGAASCFARIDLVHVAYLVRHPKATFLIDAGLSRQAGADLARFSFTKRQLLGFHARASLAELLARAGGPPPEFVVLTHVHWDHTSGLVDIPGVRVITSAADWAFVQSFKGKEPLVRPDHFQRARVETFAWDGPATESFPASHDLFGDRSVVLVPLPGHTPGALGVFVSGVRGRRLFFVGDAVWSADGFRIPSHRAAPLSRLVDHDVALAGDAIWRLRHLHEREPDLVIVPAHDGEALYQVLDVAGGWR